jgi:hypothetical protein
MATIPYSHFGHWEMSSFDDGYGESMDGDSTGQWNYYSDVERLRRRLQVILDYSPEQVMELEAEIREDVFNGVNTDKVEMDAVAALKHCLPLLRWHENYILWLQVAQLDFAHQAA